jgi:FixJ family two-component response regulator
MNELIFVIDDDQDLRESISEILQQDNFEVRSLATAEAALEELKAGTPSLAIVDNMMPGMGGMAFMPLLKQQCPGVKIIMITAFSTIDNAVAAMKSGDDDYLAKPFKKDELIVAVRRNLEELKFQEKFAGPAMDDTLACLANEIRRQILTALSNKRSMRFMDITRHLGISDHTKVNFHLKNLKTNSLVSQSDDKVYSLTPQGKKMVDGLALLSKKISI